MITEPLGEGQGGFWKGNGFVKISEDISVIA